MAPRLDCLGSGHAFSHGRYWSGFLLDGRILLDCPPQTLAHLYRLDVAPGALDLMLLSHAHSDHIGGVDLLLLDVVIAHGERLADRPLAVAGPPGIYARLREVIGDSPRLPAREDSRLRWLEQDSGSAFSWAGVEVECITVEHAPDLVALGYRVHLDGSTLAYTGDARLTPAIDELAAGADLLIVECGGERAHGHFEWDDVRELRARLPASTRMLVTHYDHATAPDPALLTGVELAQDLARYEL